MKTRIVAVCIKGEPIKDYKSNKKREKILEDVIKNVKNKWKRIDAIIFPGGFFFLNKNIGKLPYKKRVKELNKTTFHKACIKMCRKLPGGSLIIAGVDYGKYFTKNSDQFCVAWDRNGIKGIGRKIFPTKKEGLNDYLCYEDDYKTKNRIVKLKSGENAILCACYDMFGCSENYNNYEKRTKCIKHIFPFSKKDDFKKLRKKCVQDFIKLLKSENVTIGIVAIHNDPTRYWQCHGIDTCSAALNGIAIGASHFKDNLPTDDKITLASYKKPKKILKLKDKRKRVSLKNNETYKPKDFFYKDDKCLVRLFEF